MDHGRRRLLRRKAVGAGIVLATVGGALAVGSPIAATPISVRYGLNPQLKLITTRVPETPLEIRKLVVKPGASAVPDIAPAASRYPMYALPSRISANSGAIAGVNGDFGTKLRQPSHDLMIDGELWTTGQTSGTAIAWSESGRSIYIGRPQLRIRTLAVPSGTALFDIAEWNAHPPTASRVAAYTSRGGAVTVPPGVANPGKWDPAWCAARLEPLSSPRWNGTARTSIVRTYTVSEQPDPCPQTPLDVGTAPGAVVVASEYSKTVANKVQALRVGDTVKIAWTYAGWPGVTDVMGAGQMLVDEGVNVAPPYVTGAPYILNYNPRTAVGIRPGCSDTDTATPCRLFLMTVDGRQASTDWSMGVRLPHLADLFIESGASMAVNLDGGGSTTMWLRQTDPAYCQVFPSVGVGCLVQRPSQTTGERATRSAFVVLPAADTGAPPRLR